MIDLLRIKIETIVSEYLMQLLTLETSKVKSKIKYDILSQHAVNRFRKDKKYFKVMEKFNTD